MVNLLSTVVSQVSLIKIDYASCFTPICLLSILKYFAKFVRYDVLYYTKLASLPQLLFLQTLSDVIDSIEML